MNSSLIQIIILNWNGYQLTKDCLISLQKIKYKNVNILVVDNNSTDGMFNKLTEEFYWVEFIKTEENLGFAGGNNFGIRYAVKQNNPDYFVLLNNDTTVDSNFLHELLQGFSLNKEIGAVAPKIYYYDYPNTLWYAGGKFNKYWGEAMHIGIDQVDKNEFNTNKEIDFISGCCLMISKKIINDVGFLDESFFAYCEDLDYCLRISDKNYKLWFIPESIIYHKVSASFKKSTRKSNKIGSRSDLAYYLNVRNRILIFKKHSEKINTLGFIFYQIKYIGRYMFGFAITNQFKKMRIVLKGLKDGVKYKPNE